MWDRETLVLIMRACIIMHNMIVEDERVVDPDERFPDVAEMCVLLMARLLTHLLNLSRHIKRSETSQHTSS